MGGIRLRLPEPHAEDQLAGKIREQGLKHGWEEDADGVLYHKGLLYFPEVIRTEFISTHHDNPLTGHFGIDKTQELIAGNITGHPSESTSRPTSRLATCA